MVLLADYPQPYRSVFNYGDTRHDKFGSVVNEEGTRFQKNLVKNEPTRKNLDWLDSQVCNQGSMTMRRRQVTNKIGFWFLFKLFTKMDQQQASGVRLIVNAKSWQKDSFGLFDFECKELQKHTFKMHQTGKYFC